MAGNHRVALSQQSFENPMLAPDSEEEDDEEGGSAAGARKLTNPMLVDEDGEGGEAKDSSEGMSTAQMIAANESEMGDDELEDLTYAFQAADLGGEGVITDAEFGVMVRVMGCEMTEEDVRKVIAEAVDGFSTWKKMADKEAIKTCRKLWDEYNVDDSDILDMQELNAIVQRLAELGAQAQPFSKGDIEKDGGLTFEEFSAWFLEQEGLPEEFMKPDYGALAGGAVGRGKTYGLTGTIARSASRIVGAQVSSLKNATDASIKQQKKLLHESAKLAGAAKGIAKQALRLEEDDGEAQKRAAALLMGERGSLMFAEFVFLMRSGALKKYLPPNWQDRILDYVKLREAFDCADVDGNDQLQRDELDMVVLSINAKAQTTAEDVGKVWEVLNPDGKDWIGFSEYVTGMLKVKERPELRGIVPIDVPNRFELLSLLVDSPISKDQEALIFDKLTWLEKAGIRMLEAMRKPMDRAQVHKTMQQVCSGRLHYLTDEQRRNVLVTHWWCVAQALFIGVFFTIWPGMLENFLVSTYGTDGVFDAYWTCPEMVGDPSVAPWDGSTLPASYTTRETCTAELLAEGDLCSYAGPAGNQLLPATPGKWGVRHDAQCPPGTCTSIPANFTEFMRLHDGNKAMGGNWTDGDGPCYFTGIPPRKECYDDCTPLGQTWSHSPESIQIFWAVNTTGILIGIICELSLLMYTAVRSAVKVSRSLDLRLTPLNADRAFVANMLVRAAFEMADPSGAVMGVESSKETKQQQRSKFRDFLAVVFIKGKVVLTGTAFKQITMRVVAYDTATWLKPYSGTMLATGLWDAMMCHTIMKNAEFRAFGVTTCVEVFNEIIDTFIPDYDSNPKVLPYQVKVQILRAIGVAIVKHGSMFPTMELLLRHAVNYLDMKKSKAVTHSGVIDSEDLFMDDMEGLTLDQHRAVMCTHMLTYVLDGSVSLSEVAFWGHVLKRVEELYQVERQKFETLSAAELRAFIILKCPKLTRAVERVPIGDAMEMQELNDLATSGACPMPENVTHFDKVIPQVICQKFRNNAPVSADMLQATFDPEKRKDFMSKFMTPKEITKFLRNETIYKVTSLLTKQI